jgi:hypothetical protein
MSTVTPDQFNNRPPYTELEVNLATIVAKLTNDNREPTMAAIDMAMPLTRLIIVLVRASPP